MGDRANVVFNTQARESDSRLEDFLPGSIVLYSHWGGYTLGTNVASALEMARNRWEDEGYAIRIMVSQIIGNQWHQETGFGLHVGLIADNERPVIVVDFTKSRIIVFGDVKTEYPFNKFARLSPDEAEFAHLGPVDADDD